MQLLARFFAAILLTCGGLTPLLSAAEKATDECSRELLLAYFPEPFVKETLKKFNVPQNEWDGIQKDLSNKDKEVIKIVENKASSMSPNPLKDPQARQAAVKLFRETLLQVFTDVMKAHGVNDDKQIQSMLDDIQQQKAQSFAKCMQKQQPNPEPEEQNPTEPSTNQ